MSWSRANWFRCLRWTLTYLLFFDTLATSALRYLPGLRAHDGPAEVSAAEEPELAAPAAAAGRILHVSAADATCGGNTPCFRTIQAAIDAAVPADRVRIHPGQYPEQLRIFGKNRQKGASESDRIVIEADPEAPWGSVVLGPLAGARCPKGTAVDIKGSSFVTLRGLVLRNAGGRGVVLRGQGPANQAIHIERNRIHAEGDSRCSRGISIWHGNEKTLVANNLIDGTYREGIYVTDDRNGEHAIVSNTIYGNRLGGILLARRHRAVIANNLIIANGELRSGRRVGIQRRGRTPGPQGITLLGNLVCGNKQGELKGVLLDATDEGNLTPTGREGPGVAASPGCGEVERVFAGVLGEERAVAQDAEDFRLAQGSPAIDAGVALGDALPDVAAALLRADLTRNQAVRPLDGDDDGDADYDIGAIERSGSGEPTSTPSPSPTPTPSPSPTPTATPSPSPTPTPTPTPIVVPTETPSPSPSPEPTADPTPSPDPIPCLSCDVCDTGMPGICSAGRTFCAGEFGEPECRTTTEPRTESCGNAIDEDCDGVVDEGGVPEELPTTPPQTGAFVEPLGTTIKFPNGGSARGLAQGDFNQDGLVDLAVAEDANVQNGRRVSIILGNGDATFGEPTYHVISQDAGFVNVHAVLAHDFDRDGRLDLLVPFAERHQVNFFRGDGNGGFAAPVPSSMGGPAGQLQTADLNCDGILDFAALISATQVTVGFGNGDGSFAAPTSYTFNHNLVDMALTDVNGDGHPDLVTGSSEFAPSSGIGVRLNDGAGQFGDLIHTPGWSVPDQFGNRSNFQVNGIQIADFDGDTVVDAVVSTTTCFAFMKGNGDGTYQLPDRFNGFPDLDPSWTCVGGGTLMRRYTDNVAPDFNADGKPDVLFYWDENRVAIGIGRGDGKFDASVFAASAGSGFPGSSTYQRADGSGTQSAIVVDVNGDCMLDIVTTGRQTNATQGRMGVLLARAPGDFHAPRIAPLLRDPVGDNGHQTDRGVVAGDFDNDGNPDFAAGVGRAFFSVPGAGMGIDIWEGDGDGRGKALPITLNNYAGTGGSYVRTADFDQDGFLDFIFQGGDGPFGSRHSVSTVFGEGDFTFIDRQAAYSPRLDANEVSIRNMITADLDGDEDPDVVALYDNGGFTKWFATFSNTGTRAPLQFVDEVEVGQGSNGRGIVAADFDGDDIPDLVAQDSGFANPQRIRLFKGNGDLTFEPGVSIFEWTNQGAASAEDFAAADLDEDGDQDLVMAQYFHPCAYVFIGHDDGTFDAPVCYPFWTSRTNRLAIDDFDVDGSLDIVAGVEDGGLMFLRGRGDGTFQTAQIYAVGRGVTEAVNVADFNRDGRPDLLWSYNDGNFGHSIVLSNPTGAPTPEPTLPPGVTPTPSPQPTASPSPSPTPSPRATASPPADLESIVVEPVDKIILAGETQAYTATGVRTDGTSLDLTGGVAWSSSAPGVATMSDTGTATGVSGGQATISAAIGSFSDSTTLTVGARVGDGTPPVADITSPPTDSEVTGPVDVVGTASDANFLKYELSVAPAGETAFTIIATGGAPVTGGILGQLDPTLLLNDQYAVRLTVFDRGGNKTTDEIVVQVAREQKVGLFTVGYRDLEIALGGLPIVVNRIYDSRDKAKGDFGFGWRLDVQTLRLRTNRVLGTGWVRNQSGLNEVLSPTDFHKVSVTLPGGKVEEFDLRLFPTSNLFSLDATMVTGFTPRPGTLGTLEALANPNLLILNAGLEDELVDDTTLNTYDPQLWRYTTVDGTKIEIHRTQGVQKVTDRNGNSLTFGPGGIVSSLGEDVGFTRDAEGRITVITDPAGKQRLYTYDANGDLITSTDQASKTTLYEYDRKHGLLEITDPAGHHPARNEYDDEGRLIATTDAEGKRIEFTHDLGAMTEVVRDRLGHPTTLEYDAKGNVTSRLDALGHLTEYTHDARGNQLTETDALGRVATRTYDAQDNVLTSTDFEGNTTTFTYNARGQALTVTDPEGGVTTNVYDANGNLRTTTDPEGNVVEHTYDGAGKVLTRQDAFGLTQFGYDGLGRSNSDTNALGQVTTRTFDANGAMESQTTTRTLPGGGSEAVVLGFDYDDAGRPIRLTEPTGADKEMTYSDVGDGRKISSTTDGEGNTRHLEYDARGKLTKTTYPDGSTSTSTYDDNGRVKTSKDRDGSVTSFEYDALGRQTKVTNPDGTTVTTTYDDVGRVLTRTDERGKTTEYAYTAPNEQTVTDPLGKVTVHQLDSSGRRVETLDALGHTTKFEYDSKGNLTKTTFHDGSTATTSYGPDGRKLSETDQAGKTKVYGYDAIGRLETVTDAAGGVTTYAYDEMGRIVLQTDANGHATRMEYDVAGRLTKRIRPLGQEETFAYDDNGNQTSHTDFNGETTSFVYDANDRLETKTLPGGATVAYDYTPEGRRTQAGDDLYEYDSRGRLKKETKASGEAITYGYDDAGNRTSVTTPHGTTTYEYDDANRLESVTDAGGTTTYVYDDVGNLESTTLPNGTVTTFTYDDLNRLTEMVNTGPGGLISSYTYTLGPAGNRTQVVEAGPATTGRTVTYEYDDLYRLTEETIDEPGTADDQVITYTHDDVGNRLTKTVAAATTTTDVLYSYDDNDRLSTESTTVMMASRAPHEGHRYALAGYGLSPLLALGLSLVLGWRRRNQGGRRARRRMVGRRFTALVLVAATALLPGLAHANLAALVGPRTEQAQATSMTTITSTYDDNGNLETRSDGTNTDTHSYDAENRLIAADIQMGPDSESITYTYDADGLRTSRTDSSAMTEYLTDKNREFGEVLAETTGATVVTYTYGHHRIRQSAPGAERFYVYDGGLSTRQLADASGAVTDTYTYDAFGVLSAKTGTTPNAYLYRGEHLDPSSGSYYLRARYYSPEVGRFLTTDPVAGSIFEPLSLHRYLYAHANPVDNRDPAGTTTLASAVIALSIRAIQIGAVVGFAFGAKTAFIDGGSDDEFLRSFVFGFILGFSLGFALSASLTYHGTVLFARLFVSTGALFRIPFHVLVSIHRFVSARMATSLSAAEAVAFAAYPITAVASLIGGAVAADGVDKRLIALLQARRAAEEARYRETHTVIETIRRGPRGESIVSALQEGVDAGITTADDDGLVREFEALQRDLQ